MKLKSFTSKFVGRLSGNQAAEFGALMTEGVGYITVGPFALLVNLPAKHQKADAEPYADADFPWNKLAPAAQPNKDWQTDRVADAAGIVRAGR